MRIQLFLRVFLIPFSVSLFLSIDITSVGGQCLNSQRSLLLQLKNSLSFDPLSSSKLVRWDQSIDDCFDYAGVGCDTAGYVIELDLSSETINGGINDSSTLFDLRSLRSLNLAENSFDSTPLASGFGKLTDLSYLNLSNSGFSGQVPGEFSSLTRLVTLDLSASSPSLVHSLNLENPSLAMLAQNLTQLEELYLDGVNISATGYDWGRPISFSLPNLRVLSLSNCLLSGPIDSSLVRLESLSVVRLSDNILSAPFAHFFANFSNLTVLSLSSCNLLGTFPAKIFQIPTLQTIDLSNNRDLLGSFPEFPQNGSLQTLDLSYTMFSGTLPDSIGNLRMLSSINLRDCNFSGSIPNSISNLTQLVSLDLSSNEFTGSIPALSLSKNLNGIRLSNNRLTGDILASHWQGLQNLESLDLSNNSLHGNITTSLFSLPLLRELKLSLNQFSGLTNEIPNVPSYHLESLDLSANELEGPIPQFVFELHGLYSLVLASNKFNGTLELITFESLGNLSVLNISYNNLLVQTSGSDSGSSLPQFNTLSLASCKLENFPDLRNQTRLAMLDLSDNQIEGEIPNWLWILGRENLRFVDLSHNLFSHLQEPYNIIGLDLLDLHSNSLQGKIPIPPRSAVYVDYSSNSFTSSIPADIGNQLPRAIFLSIANNKLTGTIPPSICEANSLAVLDLSNNALSGEIPSCLIEKREVFGVSLGVLNLRRNNLHGNISGTFPSDCGLNTLDLSGNHIEGQVPKSLANCTKLEILNLGNNQIHDAFPCWLKNSSSLRVLVLRSNRFYGQIGCPGDDFNWPNLQIIDLASNNFTGELPPKFFSSWRRMTIDENDAHQLRFDLPLTGQYFYQLTVTVVNKGAPRELVKILTIFTSIDFSGNKFHGEIPQTVGALKSLSVLGFSQNALTGPIPSSFGNLRQLESLDLSVNHLSGQIPIQLASLAFLAFLNLSHNQLSGMIPTGPQLRTFTEASFDGNKDLCGFPLNKTCSHAEEPEPNISSPTATLEDNQSEPETEFYITVVLGFVVGLGIIVGPLIYSMRWRKWYYSKFDQALSKVLHQRGQPRG